MSTITDWILVGLTFLGLLITIIGGALGLLTKKIEKIQNELNVHKLYTANHYAKDAEINRKIDDLSGAISKQMQQNFELLKELLNNKNP